MNTPDHFRMGTDNLQAEAIEQLEIALDKETADQKNFHIRQALQLLKLNRLPDEDT